MSGTYGVTTKLGIDTNNPVTKRFNFMSDGVVLDEEHVQTAGLVGTRREPSERVRTSLRRVGGPIVLQPTPIELANGLMQFIMGGTPSGTSYPLADTLPTFFVTSDRGSKVFTYNGCAVDKATFRSTQGGPLTLTLDVVCQDETPANSGTFPAINIDMTENAFMHQDLVLTINAVAYKCPDFELVIDNMLDKDRFFNSATLTSVQPTGRQVLLNTKLPFGDSATAYNLAFAGVSASAVFTSGAKSLTFTLAALHVPRKTPPIEGRNEVYLPINAVARAIGTTPGTTDEVATVLVS